MCVTIGFKKTHHEPLQRMHDSSSSKEHQVLSWTQWHHSLQWLPSSLGGEIPAAKRAELVKQQNLAGGAHFKSFEVSSTRARLPRWQVDPRPGTTSSCSGMSGGDLPLKSAQTRRETESFRGRNEREKTSGGSDVERKWEWSSDTVGSSRERERGNKELGEVGGGECFYPHVHSVSGVSECDCSWTGCQNSAATTAPTRTHAVKKRSRTACTRKKNEEPFDNSRIKSLATAQLQHQQPFWTCVTAIHHPQLCHKHERAAWKWQATCCKKKNVVLPGKGRTCGGRRQDPPRRGCPGRASRSTASSSPRNAHTAEARERDGQPHGRDTCGVRGKQEGGGGGTERGGEGQRQSEGTRVKVCNTEGTLKGGRGQVSGGEREGRSETGVVGFREQSFRVGVFSTLTEEKHHYSFRWQPALTQLVK